MDTKVKMKKNNNPRMILKLYDCNQPLNQEPFEKCCFEQT